MKDLAEGLAERGHRVTVATSHPQYNLAGGDTATHPRDSFERGVRVLRAKTLPHHRVNRFVRGIAQLVLPRQFMRVVQRYIHEPIDAVIVHSPPLPLATAARSIQKRYGARFFLNAHDIFPQNAIDLDIMTQKPLIRFFERMERRAYRVADVLVVPSVTHQEYLMEQRGVAREKIHIVPHSVDTVPFEATKRTGRFRKQYGLEGKFIFLFAGVLGPSQGLDLLIRLADRVRANPDIVFLFVGDGTEKETLVEMARERALSNVHFQPFIPSREYPELVKDADVGVICLTAKNTTPAVPAKLMGYMASGVPIAAFLHRESDGHNIVRDAQCGFSALSDDEAAALAIVERLYRERGQCAEYGARGFAYAKKHYTKNACLDAWEKVLAKQST
jgi:glycosyltransferase involved in cell wall biosynthesis